MRKKVFLNGRFLTQHLTGVQRTAFELVKGLDNLIDEEVISSEDYQFQLIYSGKIVTPIQLKRIEICKKGFLTGNLWEQIELPIYTFGSTLISMCTVSTLVKRNQIVIVHDASPVVNPHFFSFIFRTWFKIATTILGLVAKKIVTVSNFSKAELVNRLGVKKEKIEVIYNAADHILRHGDPSSKFKERIDQLKPFCLAVSSLSENKNFKGLSQAINKTDFTGYNMVLAGGISNTLNSWKPDKTVTYLGYVSDAELKYLYSHASLFIFPSFYEGFGIPPLEAMTLACPVLASSTSSLPEVLGDACEYFDPYNSENLATILHILLNNKKKLNLLREKGQVQSLKYNWKKSALYLYKLIENIK